MHVFIYWLCQSLGITALVRFLHRRSLTILLYHGVAPQTARPTSIANYRGKFIKPAYFAAQLRYLQRHYTIMPLEEAVARMNAGTLPPYALAITFDDGYENNYQYAFPILKELHLPATFFVTTDFVFKRTPLWVDRLEYALDAARGSKSERIALDSKEREQLKKVPTDERERQLAHIESSLRCLSTF